jgi:hypothetical protein
MTLAACVSAALFKLMQLFFLSGWVCEFLKGADDCGGPLGNFFHGNGERS